VSASESIDALKRTDLLAIRLQTYPGPDNWLRFLD
jgi:hypothetical protein